MAKLLSLAVSRFSHYLSAHIIFGGTDKIKEPQDIEYGGVFCYTEKRRGWNIMHERRYGYENMEKNMFVSAFIGYADCFCRRLCLGCR